MKPKMEIKKGTIKRLFSYMKRYKMILVIVVICILLSSFATVRGSLFLKELIDENIVPMIENNSNDYSNLVRGKLN